MYVPRALLVFVCTKTMDKAKMVLSTFASGCDQRSWMRLSLVSFAVLVALVIDPAVIEAVHHHFPLGTDPSRHSDVFAHAVEGATVGIGNTPAGYWTWTTATYTLNMWLWFWRLFSRAKTSELALQLLAMSALSMFTNSLSPGVLPENTVQMEPFGISTLAATVLTATHTTLSPRFALLCILWRSEWSIGRYRVQVVLHAISSVLFLLMTQQATVAVMTSSLLMALAVSGRSQLQGKPKRVRAANERIGLVMDKAFIINTSSASDGSDSESGSHQMECTDLADGSVVEFNSAPIELTRVLTDRPPTRRDIDTPVDDVKVQIRPTATSYTPPEMALPVLELVTGIDEDNE